MTINKITDTPMAVNVYNCRSITVNKSVTKNCVRQADGTLWAVVGFWSNSIAVIRSTDNGFSWSNVLTGIESGTNMREESTFTTDGLFAYLIIDERWRTLDVYMGEWDGTDGLIDRARYNLDDLTEAVVNTNILIAADDPYQAGSFDMCHNHEQIFLTWLAGGDGLLQVTRVSPRTTSVSSDLELAASGAGFGLLSTCCSKNGEVHIAFEVEDTGDRILYYVLYDSTTPSFGTKVEIENMGATPAIGFDISIALDGLGGLCVIYHDQGDDKVRYATSIDSGANWDVVSLTRTATHGFYSDKTTTDKVARTNIIGGSQGGFILTYVEDDSTGTPRTYFRRLTTDDAGATYDLQAETEIATTGPWSDEPITGAQFFHPTDVKLLDITDPGLVRVAYTVGEGDSLVMADTVPITLGQELLSSNAYPTTLDSEASSHTLDTADTFSLRVLVDIHAGPIGNVDYYSAGFTGNHTDRFKAAFDRLGTSMRLLRHEPLADNFMSDRSAYDAPTESNSLAIFTPKSYAFPTPAIVESGLQAWIEKDTRKIYLPPDLHLERTFIVNQSGYLKRTVWLCEFGGNQYELSQVIPYFLSNQICYYEANAYVVGPSNDPFSRTILPSET